MALPDDQYPPLPPSRLPTYDSDYSIDLSLSSSSSLSSPCCSIPDKLKPWLGIGSWVITSIGFLLAIAFWKNELFIALDDLSHYLQNEGMYGYGIIYLMIFVTTIPPFPLYSTLIVLSGYTFGTWPGAFVSYTAALSGAIIVFLFSRHYFRDTMSHLLTHTTSLRRAVRAIERKPQLLLLIRIAPYPYNLMNVLLAASHTLSFTTYLWCTALSLCKVVIHTSIGAGIHSFAAHHLKDHVQKEAGGNKDGSINADADDDTLSMIYTISGIVLCVAIFLYLTYVARRAVNDELDNDDEDYRGHLGHLEGGSRGRNHIRTSSAPSLTRSVPRSSRPSHQPQSLSRPHSPHSRPNSRHPSLSRTSYTHHRSTRSFTQLPQARESRVRLLDEDEMSMRQVDFET